MVNTGKCPVVLSTSQDTEMGKGGYRESLCVCMCVCVFVCAFLCDYVCMVFNDDDGDSNIPEYVSWHPFKNQ